MEMLNLDALDDGSDRKKLNIKRPVYTKKDFDDEFLVKDTLKETSSKTNYFLNQLDPRRIFNLFTFIKLMIDYDYKNDLMPDIMSGFTVGILHIPQSLAYGALTSLAPVHGFYTSFYCGLTYVIFGTSKHLSVGTYALVCLMIYSAINRIEFEHSKCLEFNTTNSLNNTLRFNECKKNFRIEIATSLTFWCGIFQILFAIFKFGSVYKYLSQPMLRGFTTAAACFVFSTQMQHVFGIYDGSKSNIFFKLLQPYIELYKNALFVNWVAVAISVISIIFLITTKILINDKFKKQLRSIPIPVELIVIIIGTIVSYYFNFNENYHLAVVGKVPSGLVKPSLPNISLFKIVIKDALVIGIVAFASSISIVDMYSRKHKYKINSNQELFALGMCNLVGSFFQCFISSGALARSAVFENSGGRSQLVTIIASGIIALVLLWISPLLETLPKACLGAIIIAALINLFKQFNDILHYWKLDKKDFIIWIITFMSSILLDIDYGLVIGILAILIMNTYKFQKMKVLELGQIRNYEIHFDIKKYKTNKYDYVKIIQPTQSLHYINCDKFHSKLNQVCPLNHIIEKQSLSENCNNFFKLVKTDSKVDDEISTRIKEFKVIILDFESVQFVDEAAVKCLEKILNEYDKQNVQVLFTNCNDLVRSFFKKMNCEWDEIIYLTISDAIISITF